MNNKISVFGQDEPILKTQVTKGNCGVEHLVRARTKDTNTDVSLSKSQVEKNIKAQENMRIFCKKIGLKYTIAKM